MAKRKLTDRELEILDELDSIDKENPSLANRIFKCEGKLPYSRLQTKVVMHVALGIAIGAFPMVVADSGFSDWRLVVRCGVVLFMGALAIGFTAWMFCGDNHYGGANHFNTHKKLNIYAIQQAARGDTWEWLVMGLKCEWTDEDSATLKRMAKLWAEFYNGKTMPNETLWLCCLAENVEKRKIYERIDQKQWASCDLEPDDPDENPR